MASKKKKNTSNKNTNVSVNNDMKLTNDNVKKTVEKTQENVQKNNSNKVNKTTNKSEVVKKNENKEKKEIKKTDKKIEIKQEDTGINELEEKLSIIDDILGENDEKTNNVEPKKVKKENNSNNNNNENKNDKLKAVIKAADSVSKVNTDKKQEQVKKGTEIIKKDPVEVLEKEIKEKSNKKKYNVLNITLIAIFVIVFSTIFAMIFQGGNTIVKGTTIKNIDVSNLTVEEAKTKLTEAIELEFIREAELYYTDEYKMRLKPDQIEAVYDINKAVLDAYNLGRNGNIIYDNYQILLSGIFGNEIEMDFTYNEESLNLIVEDIASKIPGKVIDYNYSIEEDELIITKGSKGVKVDEEKLKQDILNDITSRQVAEIIKNDEIKIIQIKADETEPSKIDINELYKEIYKEPVDAYYETEPFKLYPEEDGIDFAISLEEAAKIIEEPNKEEYKIPIKITAATKTVNDIGTEAFPYLISTFSTKYDASNTNRSKNLELSASKINGTVLMPGEEFSYNKVVGKRTVEAGYKDAKIYSNGQVVDGLGGGICQISSTLYNAVLMANLEITERRNHYFKTSYVAAGRDATVVWGSIDFKFKNTRTYPVKIEATVSNGIAEFKIHGIKEEKEYDIKILPVVTQSIPYTTTEVVDPTLAPGTRKTKQSGSSGCRVTTYLEKRLDGKVVSKEAISSDYYKPLTQIVHVAQF